MILVDQFFAKKHKGLREEADAVINGSVEAALEANRAVRTALQDSGSADRLTGLLRQAVTGSRG